MGPVDQAVKTVETGTSQQPLEAPASAGQTAVRVRGKELAARSVVVAGRTVITSGRWLKVAAVKHEDLVEGETVSDPEEFVAELKKSGLAADIFTFAQRLPETARKYDYRVEWENVAALPISNFQDWLKNRVEYSIRKGVNRSKKLGVEAKVVEFDDQLVEGIRRMYSETPVRQGKAFWHYGKDFQTLKRELGDFPDRSVFIGAYYGGELIGSLKMIYVGSTAPIMQIFSAQKHFDKRPNNALIAKAVEVCELDGKSHLIYGSFVYYDPNSKLTEFKRRNGFESIPLPRYYIPLTLKGAIALRLGLHREIAAQIPKPLFHQFLKLRAYWYQRKSKAATDTKEAKRG